MAAGCPHFPPSHKSSRRFAVSLVRKRTALQPEPFSKRVCSGTSKQRSAQKVIDSSDFLLFPPCDTREKGGVLVTEDNFGSEKDTASAEAKGAKNAETARREWLPASAAFTPQSAGRFSPILPPSGSRLPSRPPSPAVQSRRWRCCVTGKGADPHQPPLPLHCSHTMVPHSGLPMSSDTQTPRRNSNVRALFCKLLRHDMKFHKRMLQFNCSFQLDVSFKTGK